MKNEPNPPSADKFISYYMTSEYEDFMPFVGEKNKANPFDFAQDRFYRAASCVMRSAYILAAGTAGGSKKALWK